MLCCTRFLCQDTVVQEELSENADERFYFLRRLVEEPTGSRRLSGEEMMDVGFVCTGAGQQQVLVVDPVVHLRTNDT